MIVPATVHRLPCPRYVQVVEPDDRGHLPALMCPHGHKITLKVQCWTEYGFRCGYTPDRRRVSACSAHLWLISLPGRVYVLCEVSSEEVEAMRTARMQRWEQLAYLWRPEGRAAA